MKKPVTLLILLTALLNQPIPAQQSRLDSLLLEVNTIPDDTAKVKKLNELSFQYLGFQLDTALMLGQQALDLSEKLNYEYGIAQSLFYMGLVLRYQSNYEKAIEYSQLSYELFDKMGKEAEKARVLNSLGNVYKRIGEYEKSMESFLACLKIYNDIQDTLKLSNVLNNLGLLYHRIEEYEKALEYLEKGLDLRKKLNLNNEVAISLMNIGIVYKVKRDYMRALDYFKQALDLMDENTRKYDQLLLLSHMAAVYESTKRYDIATKYYRRAIEIEEEIGEKEMLVYSMQGLGNVYLKTRNFSEGIDYLIKSYNLAKDLKNLSVINRLSKSLSWAYEVVGDYQNSLAYYKIYQSISDSLLGLEKIKQIAEIEQKYEAEKRDQQIAFLEKEKDIQDLELSNKKIEAKQKSFQRNILIIVSIIAIALLVYYFRDNKRRKRLNHLLRRQNRKIIDQRTEIAKRNDELIESNILLQQQALCSQMNPHFIFNTLNSIQYFIYENNKEASNKYLSRFSRLMRAILENSQHQYIYISNELEALELYLELEALRFENTFEYAIQCDEEAKHYKIPTLLLQPYVENAVLHGIMPKKEGKGNIAVCVQTRENHIMCSIEDNGIGRAAAAKIKQAKKESRQSLGTKITEKRMDIANMLYGKKIKIAYTDKHDEKGNPTGTLVEITLPKLET